jgi:hypothetical protein
VLLLVALTLTPWSHLEKAGAAPSIAPLRSAGDWSSYTYTLKSLKLCEVGDGLSLVKVTGPSPLRLIDLDVLFGGDAKASQARVTYQLISFRRGTTEGQLGAMFNLSALDNGLSYGPALGGVMEPLKTSQLWYDIVARVKVLANHGKPWSINGLRVTYRSTTTTYTTVLRQSVKLPTTQFCASS